MQNARSSRCPSPRAGEQREALRLVLVARRSAVDVRRQALVQLRSVIVTAPDRLRDELRRLPPQRLLDRCSRLPAPCTRSSSTAASMTRPRRTTSLGGPVEIFEVDELATPAAGEVLIDVVAAGIGNWDELVRIGSWQIGGPAPMALGTEAAGTVAAVGSDVVELREGDEVMTHPLPLRRHGTWAGRVLAPAATVAARPPAASWEAGPATRTNRRRRGAAHCVLHAGSAR